MPRKMMEEAVKKGLEQSFEKLTVQTRDIMNRAQCGNPECKANHPILFLGQDCHVGNGVDVCYHKETGHLFIQCHVCHKPVVKIMVGVLT